MEKEMSKTVNTRLAGIEGHVKAIRKMVDEDRDCEDLLMQLSAVESAVNNLGKMILKEHLNHCVKSGIEEGNVDILSRFNKVLDKYI